ncbi:hypothetical protein, partial [Armatimonas sp.]|uniref:hypothetical protein n=1 Tax=Armatimonas sp. TaxID=1872638 RepID=UPI0037513699
RSQIKQQEELIRHSLESESETLGRSRSGKRSSGNRRSQSGPPSRFVKEELEESSNQAEHSVAHGKDSVAHGEGQRKPVSGLPLGTPKKKVVDDGSID